MPPPDASHGKTTHVHVNTDVTIGFKHVSSGDPRRAADPAARLGLALLAVTFAYEHRAALAAYGQRAAAEVRRLLPSGPEHP